MYDSYYSQIDKELHGITMNYVNHLHRLKVLHVLSQTGLYTRDRAVFRKPYDDTQAMCIGVGVLYSITTFMREITPLLQIRQVARLMEHDMQPARTKPHARGAHKQPRPET